MTPDDETWSACFDGGGGFSFLSRGDRVCGIWRDVADPSRPVPVVLVCGARGAAHSDDVERALASVHDWAAAGAIDLPLCGARHSEKLSAGALEPGHPLCEALESDLERQVAADLRGALTILCQRRGTKDARTGLVAFGAAARLVRGFCQSSPLLTAHLLMADEPGARDWVRLRESLEG